MIQLFVICAQKTGWNLGGTPFEFVTFDETAKLKIANLLNNGLSLDYYCNFCIILCGILCQLEEDIQ